MIIFQYVSSSEVRIVDKITDLPVNYSKYLTNRRPESVQSRTASSPNLYDQHALQFSQPPEPLTQYRSSTYNYPSSFLFYLSIMIRILRGFFQVVIQQRIVHHTLIEVPIDLAMVKMALDWEINRHHSQNTFRTIDMNRTSLKKNIRISYP